jgi:beta-ureidopropionase / N-carbamoyl-L-amino-acid hydrolase
MSLDPKRTIRELKELRALTSDEDGAQRVAWSETWLRARAWFDTKLEGLPVEQHHDAAGNGWVTLPGDSPTALLLGGHLDSVPNGGWLDGALDLVAGLEVLRHFAETYRGRPPITIRLVDWADEEGRFGRSMLGSSAFAGTHTVEADRNRTDRTGLRLEDAVAGCGFPLDRFPEAAREREDAAAYLELHIEQGPVLEALGLPLGVVTGTKGVERHAVTFHGFEAHSGSTPMNSRRDALRAAAKLALEIGEIAGRHSDAVCTMGSLKTHPGISTAIAGRVEATLDQRDLDPGVLARMLDEARAAASRFAAEEGCTVEWSRIYGIQPVPFHAQLMELCAETIRETAGTAEHRMPAGALHDAAETARAGIPSAMMFVQSIGGVSHNKVEDTAEEHIELAVRALDLLAARTVEWIRGMLTPAPGSEHSHGT